jgi:nickel-dependent lactate racemase
MPSGPSELAYGRGSLPVIPVPPRWDVLECRATNRIRDESAAVYAALQHPIGCPTLPEIVRRGEKVAILVNDVTRLTRTDLMLPPVVETLNAAGIPDSDILVVFALGIHRKQTGAERREILGTDLFGRLENFDHDAYDESEFVSIGRTRFGNDVQINRRVWEADRIVLTGEIMFHLIAGYSGGRKSLVPGVAGWRTTTFNHNMIFDPNCRSGRLDGNPAHEDLLEACRLAEPDFLVNVVVSPDGGLLRVVAGHYDSAHRAGCQAVGAAFSAEVDEPYDLVIASAGGYPLDIDLRQAHKGLENACRALRPGGSILFFAECANGAGHPLVEEYVNRYGDYREIEQALEHRFEIGGHKAYWLARLGATYDIHLVSSLDPRFVERCHLKAVSSTGYLERLDELLLRHGDSARMAVLPHAGYTLPLAKESGWGVRV